MTEIVQVQAYWQNLLDMDGIRSAMYQVVVMKCMWSFHQIMRLEVEVVMQDIMQRFMYPKQEIVHNVPLVEQTKARVNQTINALLVIIV